jgi:MerR family transcriptional regulator/heat shock protein HspR
MKKDQPILTISVAAKLLGLHPRTLMAYERAGFLSPHRTTTKRRIYSVDDLEEIQFLKYLSKERKINVSGVKYILEAIRFCQGRDMDLKRTLFSDFKVRPLL